MCAKILCRKAKPMTHVSDAAHWAEVLVRRESRGPGDMENAMHRLEARYGISWRTFWALRYRKPADLFVGVYVQLKAAYDTECERQERLLTHEREIATLKAKAFAAAFGTNPDLAKQEGDLK